jgi:YbbR domain-containing protein
MPAFLRRITDNWKLKTLAFVLAVLLWVVYSADEVTSNWISVPLEVQLTDPNYRVASLDPRTVQVRFTGPARDLLDVAVRQPPLRLSITQVEDTTGTYELSPRMVQLPGQLAVNALDVRPAAVRLDFSRLDSRVVPIRPRVRNQLGPDWAIVDSLTIEPAQVRITGLVERVASISEVSTVPFDLPSDDTLFNRTVALDTAGLRGIDLSTPSTRATVRIDRMTERLIPSVPVDVGPGVTLVPNRVDVRFRGPDRVIQALTLGFFRVVVSIDEIPARIPSEGVLVPLRVDRLRPGVQATIEPSQVRLMPSGAAGDTIPPGLLEETDTVALVELGPAR